MSEHFDSPKAIGDLIAYAGANVICIPKGRASRAHALLRTGSSGLEHPIVVAVQVPFNKVPEAVIHPKTGEIYFVGVEDKSCANPAKVYRLTVSGRPQVIAEATYIAKLMVLGGKIAWVKVEETTPHLCVYKPGPGIVSWQLGSAVTWDVRFFAINDSQTFARRCFVPSDCIELIGKGIHNPRGGHVEIRHGLCLDEFDNDLFYVTWDSEFKRDNVTVHRESIKGGISHRHENCEFIGGSAFCDKDGTVWYVVHDKRNHALLLCSMPRRGGTTNKMIDGNPIFVSTGNHGFMIEPMVSTGPKSVTHLTFGVKLEGVHGRVTSIKVVDGKGVFILTLDGSTHLLYVWLFDRHGELPSADVMIPNGSVSRIEVGLCEPRLVQFGDWVGLEYAQSSHTIIWRNAEQSRVEFPLFASIDRLTLTDDGRVLSWHFDSGTFFVTDYTP